MDCNQSDLEALVSKTDFDFSTVSGWDEFLNERRAGGTGPAADGLQLRDIKLYAVGTANVITSGAPVKVHINVR
ncbi:hypothetical protein JMM61_20465 [Rhodovulum sulfidophilum]|uniref:hypothetical protein n=1 Tax=Rhodovulum sulfidophilum TaxID=35806 RepID=UPI001927E34D|nr:hypothetical protein [Rhodovulum sulfidophilum]MBL3587689.1 hypothetical protein [Rhodovulum sulfidophilum]